jgi:tripartite-type tricarboxylate transporter receptor subunit TctC
MILSTIRRTLVAGACLLGAALPGLYPPRLHAQENYPDRRVTLIVPFSPGGVADIVARVLGNGLAPALGQAVIVENKPGADGDIGAGYVAAARPDGYTLLIGATSTNAINPALHTNLRFDARKDFVAIANLATVPNVLVLGPGQLKANTVTELIAELKRGDYSFASGGAGGSQHLSGELFKSMTHTKILHVPYKGGSAPMADLLTGRVDMMFCNLPLCMPYIEKGQLKALGVTGKQRSQLLPNVPTIDEAGVPGYEVEGWFGLFAPTGTPAQIVEKLNKVTVDIMNAPKTRELLEQQGATPSQDNATQFGAYVRAEQQRWPNVIHDAHITVD